MNLFFLLAAVLLVSVTASAQVKPPGARDTDGNEYRYLVAVWGAPIVQVPSTMPGRRDPASVTQRKLESILLSRLKFQDTPLPKVIERIDLECAFHDDDASFPRTGFVTVEPLPGTPGWETRLTATLEPMPTWEALRIVAKLAKMEVRVDPIGLVTFQPVFDATLTMANLGFLVPPGQMDVPLDLVASPVWQDTLTERLVLAMSPDAQTWLATRGVTFPPGASAIYVQRWYKLYVYNTRENLDRIKSFLTSFPIHP